MAKQKASQLTDTELKEMRELALNSLYFFAKAILGWDWLEPHVHREPGEMLEDETNKRLQFTLPRGFIKTTFLTISYAIWRALPPREEYAEQNLTDPLHDPNVRILIVQNTIGNARKRINVIRTQFENNVLLQRLFPEIIPEKFQGSNRRWSDSHAQIERTESHPEATWEAAGVGTSLVSRHYSEIIEDDIIAPRKDDITGTEAMPTREEVEKAIGFHRSAISLLANPKDGRIINIGTRWSKFDVIQYIIDEQMPPYKRFELSALDENGNPTYPERFDKETLEGIKAEQGTYIFSSQYLNKPYDSSKMVFKPNWIRKRKTMPDLSEMKIYTSVDPAIGQKKDNDYSVILTAGVTAYRELCVLEYVRRKLNPSEIIAEIFNHNGVYSPLKVIIESTAWQAALAHFTRKEALERLEYLPIVEFKPKRAKETRIRGLQPIAQREKLFIRPYHKELYTELIDFPYGNHDDIADALAQVKIHASFPSTPIQQQEQTNETLEQILSELRTGKTGLPFADQTAVV